MQDQSDPSHLELEVGSCHYLLKDEFDRIMFTNKEAISKNNN